ncbi:MAG: flagellar basal-body MS-ring/collar protein FliF [Alphaproteobacteria bacterium]
MDRLLLAFRALGAGRILALFLGIAAVIGIMGVVIGNLNKPGMRLLYGGLNPEEAAAMAGWLDGQNVRYELRQDGSVFVPADQVGLLRLQAAGQGLVGASETGYEIFDKSSGFGTTSFVQNINAKRALEGELARTIGSLPAVQGARVHLVMPEKKLFDQDTNKPSAAVALNLGGRLLGSGQVENIARLVASSVPGLMIDEVTIIDQGGNMLFNGKELAVGGAARAGRLQADVEDGLEKGLVTMLEKVVGPGKVSVRVSAVVNTDRIEEQAEIFDPNQQVVRSEQTTESNNTSQSSNSNGAVGLAGNIPGADAGGASGDSAQENGSKVESTVNYEITRTVRNMVKEGGEVKKLNVAVLMEGKTIPAAEGAPASYTPYTTEEIARFDKLIKTAMGYNAERGDTVEIIDMPFSQPPTAEDIPVEMFNKQDIMMLVQYGVLALGIILVVFMVVRPALSAVAHAIEMAAPPPPPPPMPTFSPEAAAPSGGISLNNVEGKVKETMVKDVNEIIDQHPEETIAVIRNWMADSNSSSRDEAS